MLKNGDFFKDAEDIMTLSENGIIDGYVSASAITDRGASDCLASCGSE
jgi:hypothetical protein